jgi:hypothetical protein
MQPLGPPSWAAPTNAAIAVVVATAQGAPDMVKFGVCGKSGDTAPKMSDSERQFPPGRTVKPKTATQKTRFETQKKKKKSSSRRAPATFTEWFLRG